MVAVQLGLGHPIGQPLHTLLGSLFSHIPWVAPLVGLNFLSVLFGALAVIPAVSIAEGLTAAQSPSTNKHPLRVQSALLCFVIALCGLHAALWEQATRIEVYPIATFFALWAAARIGGALRDNSPPSGCDFLLSGVALGLSASANAFIAIAMAVAIGLWIIVLLFRGAVSRRLILAIFLGGVFGLVPFLYVFLVGHRKEVFVWGAPTDFSSALYYFQGLDFRARDYGRVDVLGHLAEWLSWSIEKMSFPVLALGVLGHLLLARGKGLGRFFALSVLAVCLLQLVTNHLWRVNNPDYLGYLAAPLWLSAAGLGALSAESWRRGHRVLIFVALAAFVALVSIAPPNWLTRTRHLDHVTRILAQGALNEAASQSILVVQSDHWVFPLLYLQLVERQRPDVTVVAYGLANSSWYWELLFRRHPDLVRIALRAPGGRPARVARFLAANQARPVRLEDVSLAATLGIRVCAGGWLLRGGAQCNTATRPDLSPVLVLDNALFTLGAGSPSTDEIIVSESFSRGEAFLRLGLFREAYYAFIAGTPRAARSGLLTRGSFHVTDSRRLQSYPIPLWRTPALLGDPARNLYMAGVLLRFAGDIRGALSCLAAAASMGLPEAEHELALIRARDR